MTTALYQSPNTSSQLYFNWSEIGDFDGKQSIVDKHSETARPSQSSAQSPRAEVPAPAKSNKAAPSTSSIPLATLNGDCEVAETKAATVYSNRLSFDRSGRIQQPVKLGEVMIRLLRRYGITDEEIAAGTAEYARQNALAG